MNYERTLRSHPFLLATRVSCVILTLASFALLLFTAYLLHTVLQLSNFRDLHVYRWRIGYELMIQLITIMSFIRLERAIAFVSISVLIAPLLVLTMSTTIQLSHVSKFARYSDPSSAVYLASALLSLLTLILSVASAQIIANHTEDAASATDSNSSSESPFAPILNPGSKAAEAFSNPEPAYLRA